MRASVAVVPSTFQVSIPSFAVLSFIVSHPPFRSSSIFTLPFTPLDIHSILLLVVIFQVSPPFGFNTVKVAAAGAWTDVIAVAVLLFGLGSVVFELTVAVFVIDPGVTGTVTVSVMGGACPGDRLLDMVHWTVVFCVQVHPSPIALI